MSGASGPLWRKQVLDRALARAGGRGWWSVLLGRVRAQRLWKLHRDGERSVSRPSRPCRRRSVTWWLRCCWYGRGRSRGCCMMLRLGRQPRSSPALQVDALRHADNYGLASCTRAAFGRWRPIAPPPINLLNGILVITCREHLQGGSDLPAPRPAWACVRTAAEAAHPCVRCRGTTLHTVVEAPDLGALGANARGRGGGGSRLLRLRGEPPLRGAAMVKQDLFDHEVVAVTAINQVCHQTSSPLSLAQTTVGGWNAPARAWARFGDGLGSMRTAFREVADALSPGPAPGDLTAMCRKALHNL